MKQKKPLPKGAVLGLIVFAALLVAVVGYMLLLSPQKSQLAKIKAEIAATDAQTLQYQAAAAAAKPTAVPVVHVADIYRLARAMPSAESMADILVELDSIARSAGVELGGISPQAPTPGNGFQIVSLQLSFTGDFFATTDFLYRLRTLVDVRHGQLEAGGRIFAVQQGTLTPGTGAQLTGQVTVQTYVYGTATTTPAAAPAAPAPTSTDTTATTTAPTPSASAEGAP